MLKPPHSLKNQKTKYHIEFLSNFEIFRKSDETIFLHAHWPWFSEKRLTLTAKTLK